VKIDADAQKILEHIGIGTVSMLLMYNLWDMPIDWIAPAGFFLLCAAGVLRYVTLPSKPDDVAQSSRR